MAEQFEKYSKFLHPNDDDHPETEGASIDAILHRYRHSNTRCSKALGAVITATVLILVVLAATLMIGPGVRNCSLQSQEAVHVKTASSFNKGDEQQNWVYKPPMAIEHEDQLQKSEWDEVLNLDDARVDLYQSNDCSGIPDATELQRGSQTEVCYPFDHPGYNSLIFVPVWLDRNIGICSYGDDRNAGCSRHQALQSVATRWDCVVFNPGSLRAIQLRTLGERCLGLP